MRWKALLQAECWCLGRVTKGPEAGAGPPKEQDHLAESSPLPPVLLSGFRSQSCLTLALSHGSLSEVGTAVPTVGHWEGYVKQGLA